MRGRPDYWRKVIGGKGIWGEGQSSFWALGSKNVGPGSSEILYELTLDSNQALHLYSINWASESFFVSEGWIQKNGITIADYLFEFSRDILFGTNAGYYFGPGDNLKLYGGIHGDHEARMVVNALGFIEIH